VWYKNTPEILKDAKKKYKIAKQNEERKKSSEDRRLQRKEAVKKRYIIVAISIGMIALLVVVSILAFFIPNGKYKQAKKDIKAQKYEKAATEFKNLNGFLKSESYLAQAYYNLGLQALTDNDEEKASDYFQKGYDADEKSDYGKMSGAFLDYYSGTAALEEKDYDKAMELFKSSANAASDFNLTNKAGAGMAQIYYLQGKYENAWNTIKNVYAKDTGYQEQYGEYGYGYAKSLVDSGKIKDGMEIYNTISKYTKSADLNKSVYNQAVKLGEKGKISEAMNLLSDIKDNYSKANKLYEKMYSFNDKVQYWVGLWKHHGVVNGEKKTYRIRISEVLYKGEMCLRIVDKNNDYLGFDTVISSENHVTQIEIGTYQLHFKLKKFHDQKFTYTLKGGKKMVRELKYDGKTYTTKYKKKVEE
jgi:tetratricopeptide (TPR) repeat protein